MQKSLLIGVNIVAVFLLVLGSLTNVVGYQVVQSSNQKTIKTEVDQKELLFQTIMDIVNNKEIQNIIKKYESRGSLERFLQVPGAMLLLMKSRIRFGLLLPLFHILTKNYLEYAYIIGLWILKILDTLKIHSLLKSFKVNNQMVQKRIAAVIEKNDALNKEIEQLSDVHCDCKKNVTWFWHFPIMCAILYVICLFLLVIMIYYIYIYTFSLEDF